MSNSEPIARSILSEATVKADPIEQFRIWYAEAERSGVEEPEAMTLATATRDGKPSARVMLLRGLDERGFVFYTNYASRKGRTLDENPRRHWSSSGRGSNDRCVLKAAWSAFPRRNPMPISRAGRTATGSAPGHRNRVRLLPAGKCWTTACRS